MKHHTRVRPVPVPEWVLHQPLCSCSWGGDLVRTQDLAQDQITEHLADQHLTDEAEQPALFDT